MRQGNEFAFLIWDSLLVLVRGRVLCTSVPAAVALVSSGYFGDLLIVYDSVEVYMSIGKGFFYDWLFFFCRGRT